MKNFAVIDSEAREFLKKGLEELRLPTDDAVVDRLVDFGNLLMKWNKTYNLTSITNAEDVVRKHLLDSAAFAAYLNGDECKDLVRGLDVGSGGGLPGIPCAILCPEKNFTMVDAVGKKVTFLNQAILQLRLKNIRAVHTRIENLKEPAFDFISSRAFSSVDQFVGLTENLIKEDGYWLAMKGKMPNEEIEKITASVGVEKIVPLNVPYLEEERHLVVLKKKEE